MIQTRITKTNVNESPLGYSTIWYVHWNLMFHSDSDQTTPQTKPVGLGAERHLGYQSHGLFYCIAIKIKAGMHCASPLFYLHVFTFPSGVYSTVTPDGNCRYDTLLTHILAYPVTLASTYLSNQPQPESVAVQARTTKSFISILL